MPLSTEQQGQIRYLLDNFDESATAENLLDLEERKTVRAQYEFMLEAIKAGLTDMQTEVDAGVDGVEEDANKLRNFQAKITTALAGLGSSHTATVAPTPAATGNYWVISCSSSDARNKILEKFKNSFKIPGTSTLREGYEVIQLPSGGLLLRFPTKEAGENFLKEVRAMRDDTGHPLITGERAATNEEIARYSAAPSHGVPSLADNPPPDPEREAADADTPRPGLE